MSQLLTAVDDWTEGLDRSDSVDILYKNKYWRGTKFGEELNLANWQIATQSPSLNLTNIFL